VKKFKQDRK